MLILGIETSCDETAASLIEIKKRKVKILSNVVSSQIKIHQKYGGIVPEVAARKHLESILYVIKKALKKIEKEKIDFLTVTTGPGLITSLLIGVEVAKTLAYAWQKPVVAINHLEGHIYAGYLSSLDFYLPNFRFPALCLIVSGGHTELVLIKDHGRYQKIGQTRDDAAGEAFDKVAKLLNLGYPGGPIISKLAQKGNDQAFNLPRPMINSHDFDFSFSGLKTAVLYSIKRLRATKCLFQIEDFCASFEQAVIEVLIAKTIRVAKKHRVKTIILTGGVAANKKLRKQLGERIKEELPVISYQVPLIEFCTDNAAMIAWAGFFRIIRHKLTSWRKLKADPNLEL